MERINYAIYKGDKFLFVGTAEECGEYLGIKAKSVQFRTTPAYKKRIKEVYENRQIVIKVK